MAVPEDGNPGDSFGIAADLIRQSCSLSMDLSHSASPLPFLQTKGRRPFSSSHAIFAFSPSSALCDWAEPALSSHPAENLSLFPSLRLLIDHQAALLHPPFLRRFRLILSTSPLANEVRSAVGEKKQIIFTGHSSGGAVAVLATAWFLEESLTIGNSNAQLLPFCITFGSPLVGDTVFGHALRREDWARRFLHFVSRHDIFPRILLSPIDPKEINPILRFLHPDSPSSPQTLIHAYTAVARNAACAARHRACVAMGSTSLLLEALPGLVGIRPYRPVGTYAFCAGKRRFVVVKNSDAVLQLLFYCLQVGEGESVAEAAAASLEEHFGYEGEVVHGRQRMDVVCLDRLERIPLSARNGGADEMPSIEPALNQLGLDAEARLCLRAAGELERQKAINHAKIINSNYRKIREALNFLRDYRSTCNLRGVGYYDSFKLQRDSQDFNANLKRLELAGHFDEIMDMLKRYELPDWFEAEAEWVAVGTEYRRLVEPLDIANYYRHSLNEDTGPYMCRGRPWRYRLMQRWLERARRLPEGSSAESCFWARVEELRTERKAFEEVRERVLELERDAFGWINGGELGRDFLVEGSTFVRWWKTLPPEHRVASCIGRLISG